MARIGFLSNAASDGMTNIRKAVTLADQGYQGIGIARAASRFRGRGGDLVVNWGRGSQDDYLMQRVGAATLLNKTANVALATNKLKSFQKMEHVNTVEWTSDREQAQVWYDAGLPVYARTKLQGHSGEGIVVCAREAMGDLGGVDFDRNLVQAPLYTKGFNNQRREFRIHVMKGVPTYVQQKKRRENWRELEAYSNIVRNFHTGWIYATADIHPNQKALAEAINAVASLGLDFGAVDVITRGEDAWVLEINTAPGNEGTNTTVYADNFIRIANGDAPLHYTQRNIQAGEVEAAEGEGADAALVELAVQAGAVPVMAPVQPGGIPIPAARARVQEAAQAAPRVQVRPVAEVAAAVPEVDRGRVNNINPVDKKFYFLEINGEETVGQWARQLNGFLVVGFAMSIPKNEVVIKREAA